MKIRLTRLSNERHRLAVERSDGSVIERELETRSVLLHDLVHYAVEAEARIEDGFWGLLARGVDFEELSAASSPMVGEGIELAEALVGPMQSVWHQRLGADRYVAMASPRAPFVDHVFVTNVCERIRKLWGHWQGTKFHDTMELAWPPPSLERAAVGDRST